MPLVEDFSVYFADFGVPATFNGTTAVNVIFDKEYLGAMGIESNNPVALVEAAKIPAVVHGDTLLISAVTYKVIGVEPDGVGMVLLQLQKQ